LVSSQFRLDPSKKNLQSKENNQEFIFLLDNLISCASWPEHKPSVYTTWDNFGYWMPKVIRHLLAKDSTGQTVQW
jgi:hypothetical protein